MTGRVSRRPMRLTERGKFVVAVAATLLAAFAFATLLWLLAPNGGAQ